MYERRLKVFLALMALGVAAVLFRLIDLQLVRGDVYRRRAEERITWVQLLPTVRGRIVDRHGRVLAVDQPCYEFCLPFRMLRGPGRTQADQKAYKRWADRQVRRIALREKVSTGRAREVFQHRLGQSWELAAELTGATRNEMSRAAENAVRRVEAIRRRVGCPVREEFQPHRVVSIVGELAEARAVDLRCRLEEMVGSAAVRPSCRRWYPCGEAGCHVIGFVGPVSPPELARNNGPENAPLRARLNDYLPGDRIGKAGVEKLCEGMVRGRRGYRRGRRTGEILENVPPFLGPSVHLTLDIDLQRALAGALARPGAIVVLNVFDDEAHGKVAGEVLAMVSLPTYDLNTYLKEYRRLSGDAVNLPLWNRAVGVRYPPGSTFKPLAALAGLSCGAITPATTFHCQGYLHNPGAFRCWIWPRHKTGHGRLEVVGALEHSCNVFFYNVGEQVGLRRQCEWLGKMGMADPPGTGLPEERRGLLPDPRRARYVSAARFLAIGQGKVAVTPMHVANAMAAIARGGEFVTPLLVRELEGRQQRRALPVKRRHLELVREGLRKVVNSASGTAHKYAYDPQIEICGKTGTAQTAPRRVDGNGNGRIDRADPIVRSGDTAWFAGFAPYRNPKIAFAVVVEDSDKGGGATCGPIARQVVRICKQLGYL